MWETFLRSIDDLRWVKPGMIIQLTKPVNISFAVTRGPVKDGANIIIQGINISTGSPHEVELRIPDQLNSSMGELNKYVTVGGIGSEPIAKVSLKDFRRSSSFGKIIVPTIESRANQIPIVVLSDIYKIESGRYLRVENDSEGVTFLINEKTVNDDLKCKIRGQLVGKNPIGVAGTTCTFELEFTPENIVLHFPDDENMIYSQSFIGDVSDRKFYSTTRSVHN